MKKILYTIALTLICTLASAENVKIEIEPATVQKGTVTTLNVMLTTDVDLAGLTFKVNIPDGTVSVTPDSKDSTKPNISTTVGTKNWGTCTSLYGSNGKTLSYGIINTSNVFTASTEAYCIATIEITPSKIGTFNVEVSQIGYSNWDSEARKSTIDVIGANNTTTYTSELKIQRAAIFTPMQNDYALEIIPFAIEEGATSVDVKVNLKNAEMIDDVNFTLALPSFMTPTNNTKKVGKKTYRYVATTNTDESRIDNSYTKFLVYGEEGEDNEWSYTTVNNDGDAFLKNSTGDLAFTIPMTLSGTQAAGIYSIDMKDISIEAVDESYDPLNTYNGEYLASIFVGAPDVTDPVLYGHYTTDAIATLTSVAQKMITKNIWHNLATLDFSAATLDVPESTVAMGFESKLVYGPNNTSFYRNSSAYGTVCLPFALTSGTGIQYYTLSNVTDNKLVFTEAATVAANTPALFKGMINQSLTGYLYADATNIQDGGSAGGLTLKGTYSEYDLASGAGYYIADNCFYNDGAAVSAFRGYFAGSMSAKSLSICIEDATGIHDITNQLSDEAIYSLSGLKLNKSQKGAVNIINGKKVLVK